jgi:hypothetical protein
MDQASRAVRLVDRGQFKSIRKVSRATGAARSTVQDRRAGRQPHGQEEVKHARLSPQASPDLDFRWLNVRTIPSHWLRLRHIASIFSAPKAPTERYTIVTNTGLLGLAHVLAHGLSFCI